MSGIFGVFHLDGRPVDPQALDKMGAALSHRGPDASGLWNEGSIGLGHRMLRTTAESFYESQPRANPNKDLILTADARIDNREELIRWLRLDDLQPAQISDSELILHAYEKWGENCVLKLLGDFAFAIWDSRNKTLFCARDHLGVKSLYYYHSATDFIFASEIKGIFSLPEVPRRLNETRVADHLTRFFEDKAITFYQDIFRLPPAHSLSISPDRVSIHPYWSLDPTKEIRLSSDAEYEEAFREIFDAAVRCRLRSSFPIGTMLSGGLDSSSIACTSRNLLAKNGSQVLHTFSAIFPSLPEGDLRKLDERNYIQSVLASGGFEPHYIHADQLNPLNNLERTLWHMDEAFFAPNLYIAQAIYQAAQQHGVRVLFDGIDGDTTVSHGLEYLADLARSFRWRTLKREAKAISNKPGASIRARRILKLYAIQPFIPQTFQRLWKALKGDTKPLWASGTSINQQFAHQVKYNQRVRSLAHQGYHPPRTAREKHWFGINSGLTPITFELLDKAATEFSLEVRYPFFDRRLVEFCLALPPEQKLSQGWTRSIQHRAMEGILPHDVQWRFTKANLTPNFLRRLVTCNRDTLEQILLSENQTISTYVDLDELTHAFHRYNAQPLERYEDAITIYSVAILARWLRFSKLIL